MVTLNKLIISIKYYVDLYSMIPQKYTITNLYRPCLVYLFKKKNNIYMQYKCIMLKIILQIKIAK